MFKVKEIKTEKIIQVLDAWCDEYGKTWFLIWYADGWRWRPADNYCPPNYIPKEKKQSKSLEFNIKVLTYKRIDLKEVILNAFNT